MIGYVANRMMAMDVDGLIGAAHGERSATRTNQLLGAILLERNDEWAVCRRYMSLETLAGLGDTILVSPAAIAAT